jgi:hypothetical protein
VGALELAREAEVGEPHRAVGHEQDVARLEVAVDPVARVHVRKRLADRGDHRHGVDVADRVVEVALAALHGDDHGAVDLRRGLVVHDERLERPHEQRMVGPLVEARLLESLMLRGGEQARGDELQRGLGPVLAARGVDAAPRPGRDVLADAPRAGAIPAGHVHHGAHRTPRGGSRRRCSSRTRP